MPRDSETDLGDANLRATEARYVDGYRRIPDGADADFAAIERAGIEDLRKTDL